MDNGQETVIVRWETKKGIALRKNGRLNRILAVGKGEMHGYKICLKRRDVSRKGKDRTNAFSHKVRIIEYL